MNPLHDILSSIDPAKARVLTTTPPAQRLGTGSSKPATGAQRPPPRPAQPANGSSEASALKRKASGSNDVGQNKMPRKDAPILSLAPISGPRPSPAPAGARSTSTTPTTSMPYRGTAGLGASKTASSQVKKPSATATGAPASSKVATSTPKPAAPRPAAPAPGTSTAPAKKVGGYLAMLQKAKEKDATKPAAPPVKPEPTKILSKKEREAARLAAKAGKGKKPPAGAAARNLDPKTGVAGASGAAPEKRKPAELGYQGTARPTKKPVEVGYKGTARSAPAAAPAARPGATGPMKKKPKPAEDRYAGYANWSDLDDDELEDDEGNDYASDASSDMEGDIWDVEEEEKKALKAAVEEDAKEAAEELKHKQMKEERKRKLAAMNKAAAARKKY
ncbi:hypothetical protein BU23DRAFT_597503 [Bimuria novae-zelandiae CBS 107.79]|uniref:SPT2-domain-containing protein n=1 Tax=Bimuria novae-zelandiae CBS 107.79 TaxID=1447943 RepID=A0A6A5VF35_9PLEO|nr:hypothetical protein BU23DRAFT_597503 [Bimuria novae-zelandiae CBS 107.79]